MNSFKIDFVLVRHFFKRTVDLEFKFMKSEKLDNSSFDKIISGIEVYTFIEFYIKEII
ncbi:hypothetical protein LEP1GSC111_3900 [Leptospira interrogans str. UT126]|nr:hypothetical protein LEP1GSC080_0940 [Leptospira interrogans str. FPW2026]EMJ54136.1 hypothetical protein LEP1GSC111_3900 [Leptospira interrogans str. UT126]